MTCGLMACEGKEEVIVRFFHACYSSNMLTFLVPVIC